MLNANLDKLEFADVMRDKNNIIIITMKDHQQLDEIDVININLLVRYYANGEVLCKLLDARANWSMSSKAKKQAKLEQKNSLTRARAIVVSYSAKASLLNFLQYFSKFDYPQKIFSDYQEAYDWLLEQSRTN